jgi:hypothetical protein
LVFPTDLLNITTCCLPHFLPHFLPHNEELICGEPSLHRELVDVCRPFEVPGRLLPLNVELLSC